MVSFRDIPAALCHNCGTCVAVCPSSALGLGTSSPRLIASCNNCGLCRQICPGIANDFHAMKQASHGAGIEDIYFGPVQNSFLGRAATGRPTGASSGGVVSTLLANALEQNLITAAVVVDYAPSSPCNVQAKIAYTVEQIKAAAGSKYMLVPLNSILTETAKIGGSIALAGLPCHLHGIRKLQQIGHASVSNLSFIIGLYCGFNLTPEALDFILNRIGVSRDKIKRISFRGGDWPGNFIVETLDGEVISIPKHAFNFLHWLYLPRRCSLCPDLFAEGADISIGDYWSSNKEDSACSSIIVRNNQGSKLLESARKSGSLGLRELLIDDLYHSHAHLINYKKRSIMVRLALSHPRPSFAMDTPAISFGELFTGTMNFTLLFAGRLPLTRFFARYIPLKLLSWSATIARGKSIRKNRKPSKRYWTLQDVGKHWDDTEEYDALNLKTYSYSRRFSDGYRLAAPYLREGSRVLDISCRTGMGSAYFGSRKRLQLVGMATSSLQMEKARDQLAAMRIPFTAQKWEESRLPFQDRCFDAVISFETIEHVFQYKAFLRELSRVVKHNGVLLLTTPNLLWDPLHSLAAFLKMHHSEGPHRFLRRRELLRALSQCNFKILDEKTTVLIPYGPRWITRAGELVEQILPEPIRRVLCLRRILLCQQCDAGMDNAT